MSKPDRESCIAETKEWISKMVLGLNLCPFAHQPFAKDLIRYVILGPDRAVIQQISEEIKVLLEAPTEEIETTLIILEEEISFMPYLNLIDQVERLIADQGYEGIVQVASFHPDYQFSDLSSDDVRNSTNRSPYAMIHLLREDSISLAVLHHGNTEQIPVDNQARLLDLGPAGIKELLNN
jgi:hypothetical protein